MIPWFESHTYSIGPLVLQTWGTFVAAGYLLGSWLFARRAASRGLDTKHVWDMVFWMFVAAFIGARLFHVLFYDFNHYLAFPLDAIDPRKTGYAIMGGFIGAALAFTWYIRKNGLNWMKYADAAIWGLPWGCAVGRIGCFLIHDHPGVVTSFFGGVRYPDGFVRHDLGLELSVFGFLIGITFLILDCKPRPTGFFFALFLIIYGVGRFLLDFLRVADARVFWFTPTQWTLIGFVVVGAWMLWSQRQTQINGK
jgi:phosphatidylglycerol:prolipoprotein diacylglycerol transferase